MVKICGCRYLQRHRPPCWRENCDPTSCLLQCRHQIQRARVESWDVSCRSLYMRASSLHLSSKGLLTRALRRSDGQKTWPAACPELLATLHPPGEILLDV